MPATDRHARQNASLVRGLQRFGHALLSRRPVVGFLHLSPSTVKCIPQRATRRCRPIEVMAVDPELIASQIAHLRAVRALCGFAPFGQRELSASAHQMLVEIVRSLLPDVSRIEARWSMRPPRPRRLLLPLQPERRPAKRLLPCKAASLTAAVDLSQDGPHTGWDRRCRLQENRARHSDRASLASKRRQP
jgi:hypothetical protein